MVWIVPISSWEAYSLVLYVCWILCEIEYMQVENSIINRHPAQNHFSDLFALHLLVLVISLMKQIKLSFPKS